jgi:hypothetical protein
MNIVNVSSVHVMDIQIYVFSLTSSCEILRPPRESRVLHGYGKTRSVSKQVVQVQLQ